MTKSIERSDAFYVCVPHLKMFRHSPREIHRAKVQQKLNNPNRPFSVDSSDSIIFHKSSILSKKTVTSVYRKLQINYSFLLYK